MKKSEELEKIRDLSNEEISLALDRAREELFRSRLGLVTEQVENTALIQQQRKKVARILTVMRQRELGLEVQAQGTSAASAKE